MTAAMDEERRQLFERLGTMYEGYFVLTLTWFPPLLVQRKFVELMFEDDAAPPDHSARTQKPDRAFQARLPLGRVAPLGRAHTHAPGCHAAW